MKKTSLIFLIFGMIMILQNSIEIYRENGKQSMKKEILKIYKKNNVNIDSDAMLAFIS